MLKLTFRKKHAIAENKDMLTQVLQVYIKLLIHAKILLQEAKVIDKKN